MPTEEAIRIFQKYGVDVAEMPLDQIRKSRNALLQRFHPDAGGTIAVAQEINAAFDLLRNKTPGLLKPTAARPSTEPQPHPDKWAWAGHSGDKPPNSSILRNDFTDRNFIKKSMWELSQKTSEEWVIYGYDGHLFTNTIVVYGSSAIFYYMAIAMIDFQTKGSIPLACRSVFVRPISSHDVHLIYDNGKYYDQNPIKFTLGSDDVGRINHSDFMQKLPQLLDQLEFQTTEEHGLVKSN